MKIVYLVKSLSTGDCVEKEIDSRFISELLENGLEYIEGEFEENGTPIENRCIRYIKPTQQEIENYNINKNNDILELAKQKRKSYIREKRIQYAENDIVEYNSKTYSNSQFNRIGLLHNFIKLTSGQTSFYYTYPQKEVVELIKADFKAIGDLIESKEMNLRAQELVAFANIDNATTEEEVNLIDINVNL